MELRMMSMNLYNGGINGGDDGRMVSMMELAACERPTLLFLQEAVGWTTDWAYGPVARAEEVTGLKALPPISGRSRHTLVTLYDPEALRWRTTGAGMRAEVWHGMVNHRFDIIGAGKTLEAANVHLTPYGGRKAALEAETLGRVLTERKGDYTAALGDFNIYGAWDPIDRDASDVEPHDRGTRWIYARQPDGTVKMVPNREPALALMGYDLCDVAQDLSVRQDRPELLAPTGPNSRIDMAWVSRNLMDAATDYRRIPHEFSDHDAFRVSFSLD